VNIVVNGCVPEETQRAAAEIAAAHGVEVRAVAADPATEAGRGRLLAACPGPDILVTCVPRWEPAALPARADGLDAALRTHYLEQQYWAPVALVQAVMDGMRDRCFGRIVNITVAETPVQRLLTAVPSGGRSGVTAVMQGLAAQVAADNVTINQLVTAHGAAAGGPGVAGSRAAAVGATCAILCSALAGSISGMDLRANGNHARLKLVS
jgi:3-oxoacyl-[acyl-carrier protein] reductase